MEKTIAAIIMIGALLAGCATPAAGPTATPAEGTTAPAPTPVEPTEVPTTESTRTPTATPPQVALQPTATTPPTPTSTAIPTATPQPCYVDTDRDGLSDANERIVGTDLTDPDTDGDGLSDYDEATKYFTNPSVADSDGDGVRDNDGQERREYGYTLRATMAIRPPSRNVQAMNDHFQDVTLVQDTGDELILDVTFYADAYHILERLLLPEASQFYSGSDRYLAPTPLLNFDAQMSADAGALFASGARPTDLSLVERTYAWERDNVTVMPGLTEEERERGIYPEPFLDLLVTEDGQIVVPETPLMFSRWDGVHAEVGDHDWQMSHLILGKEMFYNRTHGSCGSTANFHCTILRSLGIPTRVIQTYPVLDPNDPAQVAMLNGLSASARAQLLSRTGRNHFVCEAFIGNRWARINNTEYETSVYMGGAFIKIASFASWREVDFANSHGYPGDPPRRPYRLIQVEEQPAVHEHAIPRLRPTS